MSTTAAILPARRQGDVFTSHAADRVFGDLVEAIVSGAISPGETLPAERIIAEHFGASRPIVRQAIHRLEEMGLVRCRQGGSTLVLDPLEAADPRVIALLYRNNSTHARSPQGTRDMIEKQFLQGLALTEIAARRGRPEHLEALADVVHAFANGKPREDEFTAFEERFWRAVALAADNAIYRMEVAWWYRAVPHAPRVRDPGPLATRIAFYRELSRRICARDGAAEYYLAVVGAILASVAPAPEQSARTHPAKRTGKAPNRR